MLKPTLIATLILLAGCATDLQTTSGQAYLAAGKFSDPKIAARAAYEPDLRFPARIGFVRLVSDQFTTPTDKERALYRQALPSGAGQMVQLGALEARLGGVSRFSRENGADQIRKLAASRHLDYVLIVALDPHEATAEALFLDTRTGYSYASVETALDRRGPRDIWGGHSRNPKRLDRVTGRLAKRLEPELKKMGQQLMDRARRR